MTNGVALALITAILDEAQRVPVAPGAFRARVLRRRWRDTDRFLAILRRDITRGAADSFDHDAAPSAWLIAKLQATIQGARNLMELAPQQEHTRVALSLLALRAAIASAEAALPDLEAARRLAGGDDGSRLRVVGVPPRSGKAQVLRDLSRLYGGVTTTKHGVKRDDR